MKYQIDQSGKIEQTERHTVIACANSVIMTILLKKSEKRILQRFFQITDTQKLFPYLTFAALLTLLINHLKPKYQILIDREYFGHEDLIEEKLKLYLQQLESKVNPLITFGHVGKLSHAHNVAYNVAVGKEKPTLIVNAKEVMKIILGIKKDRDRLTQEWIPGDQRSTDHRKNISQKRNKVK